MKGNIDLGTFIKQVKAELLTARDDKIEPFYSLDGVELEVSFVVDVKGNSKAKLVVVELEGGASAAQTHKVTLHLTPIPPSKRKSTESAGGGGAFLENKICYAPFDPIIGVP